MSLSDLVPESIKELWRASGWNDGDPPPGSGEAKPPPQDALWTPPSIDDAQPGDDGIPF